MPNPVRRTVSSIKSTLFNPALTSHFQVYIRPPVNALTFIETEAASGYGLPFSFTGETISLMCTEASLPGSSLMTHEQNNDFHGITERHAYRRDYGNGLDFTFIVDGNHSTLFFFESWLRYIVGEKIDVNSDYPAVFDPDKSYSRVQYPYSYKTRSQDGLIINKFERDYEGSRGVQYRFFNAFPTSVTSMPVSYEASQLLKCTVTFEYTRYVLTPVETLPTGTVVNSTYNFSTGEWTVDVLTGSTISTVTVSNAVYQANYAPPGGTPLPVGSPPVPGS